MNTNPPRQIVRAITIALLAATVVLTAIPGRHVPAQLGQPITRAATTIAAGGYSAVVSQGTITLADDGEEPEKPALTHSQARRLLRTVAPGLVDITATLPGGDGKAGTGIVLTSTGLVLTNDRVISGAVALSVHDLGNDLDYTARVVGTDDVHDIAVLRLRGASRLHTARIGGRVGVGDVVASIGNAHGFGVPSLGAGPVVALHQTIASTTGQARPLTGLIEARNSVEPGESGGPMVTTHGQVIGVTVATQLDDDRNPNGHGYAIPITTAMASARRILDLAN